MNDFLEDNTGDELEPFPDLEPITLTEEDEDEEALDPAEMMERGIIPQESGGDPTAVSPKGAMGAAQVMPYMWEAYGGGDPFDPNESKRVGTAIYTDELLRFGGNEKLALAAYNAGSPAVIRALEENGYKLKDAPYVDFDVIEASLPDETRNYVPSVLARLDNSNNTKASEYEDTPAEAVGNLEDLKSSLDTLVIDPAFSELPTKDAFLQIKKIIDGRGYWTPESLEFLKKVSTTLIDTALPEEKPSYPSLVGATPEIRADDPNPDETLNKWKTQVKRNLEEAGITTSYLGDQLDEYLDNAAASEKIAAAYRAKSVFGKAVSQVGGAISMTAKGSIGSATALPAYPLRALGAEETADSIESIANIIPDPAREFVYAVDDKGNIKFDDYGEPITNYRAGIASAIGQIGTVVAGGAYLTALGAGPKTLFATLGGVNALQTMNEAYKDAREHGGTTGEAFWASLYAAPSAVVDTVGDLIVVGSGKKWINALTPGNKVRAIAQEVTKGAIAEGPTEATQQLWQDLAVSQAINKDITSDKRLLEAGIAGGVAGGAVRGVITDVQQRLSTPPPVPPTAPGVTPQDALGGAVPRTGLPAPEERLGLPAPEPTIALPGRSPDTRQLEYAPQVSEAIELGDKLAALNVPNVEEQVRIAQEFEKLQQSREQVRVINLRSLQDLDPEMLDIFGLTAEVMPDGRAKISKKVTYIPEEIKDLTPEGLDARIEKLTLDLATAPKPEDAPYLVERRKEVKQELAQIDPIAKEQAASFPQLKTRYQDVKRALTRLNRDLNKPDSNKRLIQVRKKELNAELRDIREALNREDAVSRAAELTEELRNINGALKDLSKNTFANDIKAKETELDALITTRDIGKQEFKAETEEKAATEKKAKEQEEAINQGLGIRAGQTTNWVLPFDGKWFVLNERGTPLTQGFNDVVDAVDAARGITSTEAEGGFIPRITTTVPKKRRPLVFKKRIEVPWYIITPTDNKLEQAAKEEELKEAEKAKAEKKKAKKLKEEPKEELSKPAFAKGNVTGSKSIAPEVTKFITYLAKGFGLPDIAIGTFDEFERGDLDKVLPPRTKEAFKAFTTQEEAKGAKGAAYHSKGKGLILLRSGAGTLDNIVTASHELGHLIQDTIFQNAPEEVMEAVKNDFIKFKEEIFNDPDIRVGEAAKKLQGATNMYFADMRRVSEMSASEQIYLFSNSTGFREFFANQVVPFALDENKEPISASQGLYKKIGDAFRQLWELFKDKFAKSPSLEKWLEQQFKADRAINFLADSSKTLTEEGKTRLRERKFSKRFREEPTVAKEAKEKVGEQLYEPKSPKEAAAKVRTKIDPANIEKNIAEVLDPKADLTFQERTAYGIEVINELEKQTREAIKSGNQEAIDKAADREAEFVKKLAEYGTELGRGVQAFANFGHMSFEGLKKRFKKDIESINKEPFEYSPELEKELRTIYDQMQEVKNEAPGASSFEQADNVVLNTLGQLAVNRIGQEIKTPLVNALTYYWYGNMLSGLSTQAINTFGSGINLTLRSLSLAASDPKNAKALIQGYAKGLSRAFTAASAVMRGRLPATGKVDAPIIRRIEIPTLKAENALYKALVANPINFFNTKLKFVFRSLGAADAFFYNFGKEGLAYFAASRALTDQGVKGDTLASKISNLLFDSDTALADAKAQATREWKAAGVKFSDKDVLLRAFEITEQQRPDYIKEPSHRFGQITTYTEEPRGFFGEIAKLTNRATRNIPGTRLQFPFVNVVANVLSQSLDYSPIGAIRAYYGKNLNDKMLERFRGEDTYQYDPYERLHRLGASIIGMTLAAYVYANAEDELDKDDPSFAIYARGPASKGEKETLKANGWVPYSIKIGDTYIKYSETPLAPMMAWIGEIHDAYRYSPAFNRKDSIQKFTYSLVQVSRVVTDMSFLRGVTDLVNVMEGEKSAIAIAVRPVKALVPFSGLLRDIAKSTDNFEVDLGSTQAQFLRGLPFIQGYAGKPALNAFGEPVQTHKIAGGIPIISEIATPTVGRFLSTAKPEPEFKFLNDNGMYVPKMGTNTSVGITNPSPGQKKKIEKTKKAREEDLGRFAAEVLTYEELYEINKLAGPDIKKGVKGLMDGPLLPKEKLQSKLDKIVLDARRKAKIEYLGY